MFTGARKLIWTGWIALLCGCASHSEWASTEAGSLTGRGFSVTAPQGVGWRLVEHSSDQVVFLRASDETQQRPADDQITTVSLGVRYLPADGLAAADGVPFTEAVWHDLAKRLVVLPLLYLHQLETQPYGYPKLC